MRTLGTPNFETLDRQGQARFVTLPIYEGGRPVSDALIVGYRGSDNAYWLCPNRACRQILRAGDQQILLNAAVAVLRVRGVTAWYGQRP